MRISVLGFSDESKKAVAKLEKSFNVSAKKPWGDDIISVAAETYKYEDEENTVFVGSPFSFPISCDSEGFWDVYESIALDTINNVDKIVVITDGASKYQLDELMEYNKLFDKFLFFENADTMKISE